MKTAVTYFMCVGPKSDEIRCQNLTDEEIKSVLNYEFELTEKRDGSSLSIGYSPTNRPDDPLAVCSRNYELKDMPSAYWDIVHELSLDEKLKKYCDDNSRELLVQGELVGPGIQITVIILKNVIFSSSVFGISKPKHLYNQKSVMKFAEP